MSGPPEDATTIPRPLGLRGPRDHPETGDQVLHYVIGRPIGRGGMGRVVQAEDGKLGRTVALKFMAPELAGNAEAVERFVREAKATAAIAHPNVIAVHAIEWDGNVPFIVYEYVEGATLAGAGKSLSLPERRSALRQIASGLAATHAKHIVHRDVKPANVVRRADDRIVLVDFGAAKFLAIGPEAVTLAPLTRENQMVGTWRYMSPEQINGQDIDAASDIFSLGVLAYELLTGDRPFDREPPAAVLAAIMSGSFATIRSRNPDVDEAIALLVERCLSPTPGDRPSACQVAEQLGLPVSVAVEHTTREQLAATVARGFEQPSAEWHVEHHRAAATRAAQVGAVSLECRFQQLATPTPTSTIVKVYETLKQVEILTDVSSVGRVIDDPRYKPVPGRDDISAVIQYQTIPRFWYWAARTNGDFYSLTVIPVDRGRMALECPLGEVFMNLIIVARLIAELQTDTSRVAVHVCVRGIRGTTLYATRRLELSDRTSSVDEANTRVVTTPGDIRRSFQAVAAQIFDGIAGYFNFASIPAAYYDYAVGAFRTAHHAVDAWLA